jgi:hypothetical protein
MEELLAGWGAGEKGVCIRPEGILKTGEKRKVEGQGRKDSDNVGRPGGRKGRPYRMSMGLRLWVFFGRAWSLSRAKARSLIQSWWTSRPSLVRVHFRVWLVCSTLPDDYGW